MKKCTSSQFEITDMEMFGGVIDVNYTFRDFATKMPVAFSYRRGIFVVIITSRYTIKFIFQSSSALHELDYLEQRISLVCSSIWGFDLNSMLMFGYFSISIIRCTKLSS